jgi:hypothetical protein
VLRLRAGASLERGYNSLALARVGFARKPRRVQMAGVIPTKASGFGPLRGGRNLNGNRLRLWRWARDSSEAAAAQLSNLPVFFSDDFLAKTYMKYMLRR